MGLSKQNGGVLCVTFELYYIGHFTHETGKGHPPQNPQRWLLYLNILSKQIRLWADIDRNCNTFFNGKG